MSSYRKYIILLATILTVPLLAHCSSTTPAPAGQTCAASKPQTDCVDTCDSDAIQHADVECNGGSWACPHGFFSTNECKGGVCEYQPLSCCDQCGKLTQTICGSDNAECDKGESLCSPSSPPATEPCESGDAGVDDAHANDAHASDAQSDASHD